MVGSARRSDVHRHGYWHRSAHVFLFDSLGRLLIQHRAAHKDLYAGLWDYSVGEHLQPGETFLDGALRGLVEELGVHGVPLEPVGESRWTEQTDAKLNIRDREIQQAFRGVYDGPVHPDPGEVAGVAYASRDKLTELLTRSPESLTPWFARDLEVFGLVDT